MVLDFVWRNEAAHIWTIAFRITFFGAMLLIQAGSEGGDVERAMWN